MANADNRNDFNLSLIRQQEQRQAVLEKMRGKLAGRSQDAAQAVERKRASARGNIPAWGWKIALAVALMAGAMAMKPGKTRKAAIAPAKTALVLAGPSAKMGLNDQALYWTYALYDFDRLKVSYGIPKNAIVDAGLAAEKLRALRPKVDAKTRFIIDGYMMNDRRKS
jgi:hypothetical protein